MGSDHKWKVVSNRIERDLVPLIGGWQRDQPNRLISTVRITKGGAEALGVSVATVGKHLTDAVANGRLCEILVRRDFLVMLPTNVALSPLYAVKEREQDVYRLVPERPKSRGSNGLSFLITPEGYDAFVPLLREELRRNMMLTHED